MVHQDFPHIAPNHIEARTGRLLPYATVAEDGVTSPKHLFHRGQILYSKIRPYLAKVVQAPSDGLCSADMYPINTTLVPRFLLYWLLTPEFTQYASQMQGRTVLPKINRTQLNSLPVPVPPPAEQECIVAAIDEQISRLDAAEAALKSALEKVNRMREAFLDSAVMGHIPLQDAERVPDSSENELPSLPSGWRWIELDEIRDADRPIVYGIIKPGPHVANGIPYVRVTEMKDGIIDPRTLRRTTPERARLYERASLRAGDILISKDGTIGRVAVVPSGLDGANITQHLVRLSARPEFNRDYIVSALRSPWPQRWLSRETRGVALQGVNVEDFRRLPLPIPPREIQDHRQELIEVVTTELNAAEAAVAKGLHRAARLRSSILSAAFSGKLVPQDSYESATALARRIVIERAAMSSSQPESTALAAGK
jgi:type I restriction enzyme S subunit